MGNATGISNYVFEEDKQAAEDALTQRLYEYALSQPKTSFFGALGNRASSKMNNLAREIQMSADRAYADRKRKEYLENGKTWLSQQRRLMSDKELLNAIKNDRVFRRRLITLENPDTFYDRFWDSL